MTFSSSSSTLKGLRADRVEEELLKVICDSMLKPDNFATALERTIAELRSTIQDLQRDVEPLEKAISDVEQELRRIERSWIKGRLSNEELKNMERDAQARRERIQVRLDALGTGDIEELDWSRELIRDAETSLEMAKTAEGPMWNHREAPPMWFTEVLVSPGRKPEQSASDDALENLVYDTFPDLEPKQVATTLTEALNRLQAEVWARPGELQLKGTVDLRVPSNDDTPIPGHLLRVGDESNAQALDRPSTGSP